jgi:hypothetical protein
LARTKKLVVKTKSKTSYVGEKNFILKPNQSFFNGRKPNPCANLIMI